MACTKPLRTVEALSDQSWASTAKPSDRSGRQVEAYGPEGQYSSEVQQRPHDLTHSASSRCVRASVKQGFLRLLRGVRDEEVAGSNPVTPTHLMS
jgi:hypothetical protein